MSEQPLKILIVDDEAPARRRLRELLAEVENIQIIGEASNGREALASIDDIRPDLLLLDIRMPEMDGIEAAEHMQKLGQPPAIVFTTAYDAHALEAFDKNAVDYLLKPIRLERLQKAIQKARLATGASQGDSATAAQAQPFQHFGTGPCNSGAIGGRDLPEIRT